MIPASFDYVRVATADEAIAALADPDALIIAGGHSLLPMMKLRLAFPTVLVDIGGLGLDTAAVDGDTIRIGATTTYDSLLRSAASLGLPAAIREAAANVGDVQVRNAGTIGGSVAQADPRSDLSAALLATGASVRLTSSGGTRECPIDEFLAGPFTTTIARQELITDVLVPRTTAGEGSAYRAHEDPASGYPFAGAAVLVRVAGSEIASCAAGLTGAAPAPCRLRALEAALAGGPGEPDRATIREALAEIEIDSDYYRRLAEVSVARALAAAVSRAQGEDST